MTKPPYRVPSMAEIAKIKPNGLKVISTFSGCGGSSLGYRMAGCEVIAASEFVPAAIEVYRLNAKPSTHIFAEDIRTLTPERIMDQLGLQRGQLDILDGSPPCSAFSTAGKRSEGWGKSHAYSDRHQRVDDLFYEYARILEGLQPRAFIAENVSGLVKGVAKGYFKNIFARLVDCGYQVKASVLDASWLGVPQARQRTIFIGFRNDLGLVPQFPKPLDYQYTLGEALKTVDPIVVRRTWSANRLDANEPMSTITTDSRDFWVIDDVKIDPETGEALNTAGSGNTRAKLQRHTGGDTVRLYDPETDERIDFTNKAIYKEFLKLQPGKSSDKYFQLTRCDPSKASGTLTATAGDHTGVASITHWAEPRKFTLAELRRICSFPDDFVLTGKYQQRVERLGRSVPPVMMKHIATQVSSQLLGLDGK